MPTKKLYILFVSTILRATLRIAIWLLVIFICGKNASAQVYTVVITSDSTESILAIENIKKAAKAGFTSQSDVISFIGTIVPEMQEQGYLASSIDSIALQGIGYEVFLYTGKQYKWAKLSFAQLSPALLAASGININAFQGQKLRPNTLSQISESFLKWSENNGFPFAKVWLDSISIDNNNGINATFMYNDGGYRTLDSVIINGSAKIEKNYILQYLGIKEGEAYNEQKLRPISAKIRSLLFLQEEQPWKIIFRPTDTKIALTLKDKPANQLNAIIGLQPRSGQDGKMLLTFDAVAALNNALGFGESIAVTAQKLQYKSLTIKADATWPYLFNTPIGADGHFDLYNKDTTFSRTSAKIGGRYQMSASDFVRLYYEVRGNRNINIDVASVKATKTLPNNIDANANGGGIEIGFNRTDYRLNPRKGWYITLSASALVRKIRKSDAVLALSDTTGFDYSSLYDSIDAQSNQYRVLADAAYFLPIGRSMTTKVAYFGGYIGGKQLFQNELYQIGGFKLLRGFNEESIFTNHYHVLSLEYRILLGSTSNIYFFSDNAWIQRKFNTTNDEGLYHGFGIGTSLQTKSGLFTIAYALGTSKDIPLQVSQSKIHFGYIALF